MSSLSSSPISLPRLSTNEVQAHQIIARHGAACRFTLKSINENSSEETSLDWQVSFSSGINAAVAQSATHIFLIEWAGAKLSLALPSEVCQVWIHARFTDLDLDSLPKSLYAIALDTLLNELLSQLSSTPSGVARLIPQSEQTANLKLSHAWTIAVRVPSTNETLFALLQADTLGLMLIASLVSKAPSIDNEIEQNQLHICVQATIGTTTLPLREWEKLAVRDVVLIDNYFVSEAAELWLTLPHGQGIRIKCEDFSYRVIQGWTKFMNDSSVEEAHPVIESEQALAVEEISIKLSFDLGERMLPLNELRKLQPGEIFNLNRPLKDGGVHIRANGSWVGVGELVDIDGQIGVMIRSLG